jgi:hypothetical protein
MQFTITLKRNNKKLLTRVTWIWYFILLIIFSFFTFSDVNIEGLSKRQLIKSLVLFIAMGVYYFIRQKNIHFKSFIIVVFIISIPSIYHFFGIYFTICFALFALFIYWFAQQKTSITFSSSSITIKNGISKRTIKWDSLNNAVLKDDILTLDFKSDKIIQEEIEPNQKVEGINEFFREKIAN